MHDKVDTVTANAPATGWERALPRHVGIIMDGNGRWAAARGLPRLEGHRKGVEAVRRTVRAAIELEARNPTDHVHGRVRSGVGEEGGGKGCHPGGRARPTGALRRDSLRLGGRYADKRCCDEKTNPDCFQ